MREQGRLVITFHNTDVRAWWALAAALKLAKLQVIGLAVAHAENADDHPKRNRRSFTQDLVLECRSAAGEASSFREVACPDDQARELLAAGRAVALGGAADIRRFNDLLVRERGPMQSPRIETRHVSGANEAGGSLR
jgi:hypothetical protein